MSKPARHDAWVHTTSRGLLHLGQCKCRWEGPIRGDALKAMRDIRDHQEATAKGTP